MSSPFRTRSSNVTASERPKSAKAPSELISSYCRAVVTLTRSKPVQVVDSVWVVNSTLILDKNVNHHNFNFDRQI